jgi:hypothetical protein
MGQVNASTTGVAGAQGAPARADIGRLAQNNNLSKVGHGDLGSGAVQGLGPDGKTVYKTTLVGRVINDDGAVRFFANGKRLPDRIGSGDEARNFVREQIRKGTLGQLAPGKPNALKNAALPATISVDVGDPVTTRGPMGWIIKPRDNEPARQVAAVHGLQSDSFGHGVRIPNTAQGGRVLADMEYANRAPLMSRSGRMSDAFEKAYCDRSREYARATLAEVGMSVAQARTAANGGVRLGGRGAPRAPTSIGGAPRPTAAQTLVQTARGQLAAALPSCKQPKTRRAAAAPRARPTA